MPRLLLYAPCRLVLQESEANTFSLITILENVNIPEALAQQIPKGAMLPLEWSIVTIWYQSDGDAGVGYEQLVQLIMPSGKAGFHVEVPFQMTEPSQRVRIQAFGFPTEESGELQLRLSLRQAGSEHQWQTVADYPLRVTYTKPPVGASASTPAEKAK